MKRIEYNDIIFLVGQNARENWSLLANSSNYYWFHLSAFPSCHVICCTSEINDELIHYEAYLTKENTKYRNLHNIKVNFTRLSNLKKGTHEGEVIFKRRKEVGKILV